MSKEADEVAALERRRCEALAAKDPEALRALYADDYVHCHMTAVIQNREEMIQHVLAHPRSIEPRELNIRIYGDTGIITGRMVNKMERPEGTVTATGFATQVARRFADGWKFVSFQATRVPD